MFKKLKTKLMFLNLAVAGLILLAISVIAFVLIADNIKKNSEQMLEVVTNNLALQQNNYSDFDMGIVIKSSMGIFPYIFIRVDDNGRTLTGGTSSLPDVTQPDNNRALSKEQVDSVLQIILDQESKSKLTKLQMVEKGQVSIDKEDIKKGLSMTVPNNIIDLGNGQTYRYRVVYTKDLKNGAMMYAVLQDLGSEKALLTSVGFALGACVLGGLLLMALGGLFLAGRSIRPIQASWKKQREFVADASHELRTPLAAIISNIDVVMDDPEAQVKEKQLYCQGIAEEAGRMSQLVDGLLLLARADSDMLVFQKQNVDIAAVVEFVATFMHPVAAKKDITLGLNIIDSPAILGDRDRLKQVIIQLVDNAVKYTPNGGSVDIILEQISDKAKISIRDNGIGISPEHLGKIFERFYRVDPSRERETGGHGLGLAIVKYIVEHHGGSISVISIKGEGSTFTVVIPCFRL